MNTYGDLRKETVDQIIKVWNILQNEKIKFIGQLVSKLFVLLGNDVSECQQLALDIYFEMICCEFKTTEDFQEVERHGIDALYHFSESNKSSGEAGSNFMQLVYDELKFRFEQQSEMLEDGVKFLNHLQTMFDLMTSIHTATEEDQKATKCLKMISYLASTGKAKMGGRKRMYLLYAHLLAKFQYDLKNYVEAGLALQLQIAYLDWSDNHLERLKNYKQEPECERKALLMKTAITYFATGEDFPRAIAQCETLIEYYQYQTYQYENIQAMLDTEQKYYQWMDQDKLFCHYYRVVYYGVGFSDELQNQEFVYRGEKLESIMEFTNRLKKKFPEAKMLMSSDPPKGDDSKRDQVVSITRLIIPDEIIREKLTQQKEEERKKEGKPSLFDEPYGNYPGMKLRKGIRNNKMPIRVLKYRKHDNIKVFLYTKQDQRSPEKHPENEFKDLWVKRKYIFVEDSFPTVRRRVKVIDTKVDLLTPIQNATLSVRTKNSELLKIISDVRKSIKIPRFGNDKGRESEIVDMRSLSMCLTGIIDAAVNGGTKKYIKAFLCKEYLRTNPDDKFKIFVSELKKVLKEQIEYLEDGLNTLKENSGKLKKLTDHLTDKYKQMKIETDLYML